MNAYLNANNENNTIFSEAHLMNYKIWTYPVKKGNSLSLSFKLRAKRSLSEGF